MENLIISAESTCDLTPEIIEKYDIKICPCEYFVDGKEYNTKTNNLSEKDFYDSMRNGADVKTTQVNQECATNFLEELLKTGKTVLHIGFSSGLSGTYSNFLLASQELNKKYDGRCHVVDSLCASAGQGLLILQVAKKAQEPEMTIEKLVQYAEQLKFKINHIFTVDDLKYLVKGGRVSKTTAKFANILHIKPLMHCDDEGKLVPIAKALGRKLSIKKIFDKMRTNYDPYYADIMICEADCQQDAQALAKLVEDNYGLKPVIVTLDYFIGSHAGPGTLSLFYVGDKR